MRPIKITMQAFGPYKGLESVDFTKLGRNGLYLITGSTGAGKTTIFDAISYALYGQTTNNKSRNGSHMRCKYADNDTKTFVELIFEYKNKTYTVYREPSYLKLKKDGSGYRPKSGDANISCEVNGESVPLSIKQNDTNVTKYIADEIMGISYDQFKQIAMIAQGEFRELLKSDADGNKDRRIIYQKIFGTQLYEKISQKLDENAKKKNAELDKLEEDFKSNVKSFCADESSLFSINLKNAKEDKLPPEEIFAVAEKIIDEDNEASLSIEKSIEKAKLEIEAKKTLIGRIQRMNDQRTKYERNENSRAEKQRSLIEAEEFLKEAEDKLPAIDEYRSNITASKEKLHVYDELEEKTEELLNTVKALEKTNRLCEELKTEQNKKESELEQLNVKLNELVYAEKDEAEAKHRVEESKREKENIESINKIFSQFNSETTALMAAQNTYISAQRNAIDSRKNFLIAAFAYADTNENNLEAEKESLSKSLDLYNHVNGNIEKLYSADAEKNRLRSEIDTLKNTEKNIRDFKISLDKLIAEKKNLEKAQAVYREKSIIAERLKREYNTANTIYRNNMAGILAEKLADNEPCPVCGSIHHPCPAPKSADTVDKEKLEQMNGRAETADKEAQMESDNCAAIISAINVKKEHIDARGIELFPEKYSSELSDTQTALLVKTTLNDIARQAAILNGMLKKAEEDIILRENLKQQARELEDSIEGIRKSIDNLSALSVQSRSNAESAEKEFERYINEDCRRLCSDAGLENIEMFSEEKAPTNTYGKTKISKSMLERAEKQSVIAVNNAKDCSDKASQIFRSKEEKKSILLSECGKYSDDIINIGDAETFINREYTRTTIQFKEAYDLHGRLRKLVENKKLFEARRIKLVDYIGNISDQIIMRDKESIQYNTRREELEKRCLEIKSGLAFETKALAAQYIKQLEGKVEELTARITNARKAVDNIKSEISRIEGIRNTLAESLKEFEDISPNADKAAEEKVLNELNNTLKQNQNQARQIEFRLMTNRTLLKNMSGNQKELTAKKKEADMINGLRKVAYGDNKNGNLETYIQTYYFNKIIDHANDRLYKMSKGQYELIRRKEDDSGAALSLDIKDYNDTSEKNTRSVSTLSGGESFMASLSLALGLSDEIMMSNGGIQIDAMFIDEGFGSLDDETLKMTLEALNSLTGDDSCGSRLIGIISHVSQLKESIDKQIVVEKNPAGGSSIRKI